MPRLSLPDQIPKSGAANKQEEPKIGLRETEKVGQEDFGLFTGIL